MGSNASTLAPHRGRMLTEPTDTYGNQVMSESHTGIVVVT